MPGPDPLDDGPAVSVVMTALNERRHLAAAVDSVFGQDYPGPLELVVAIGPSRDHTRELADQLAARYGHMRVVANPSGCTPAGLNLAIRASDPTRPVIVRTDGHARLPRDYVRLAVADLQRTGAANVGGMMVPVGSTPFEVAAARAMSSRIGLGSAPFHVGGAEGPAASVYLGVFRRSVLEAAGGFDETYSRAQDWELNHRIRAAGGVVWFDPRLRVDYRPRPNLARVARQFHQSGIWRWQIVRTYPETVSGRYLAAPAATLGLLLAGVGLLGASVGVLAPGVVVAVVAVPVTYLVVIAVGAAATRRGLDRRASAWYLPVLATMHLSWGAGFLRAAARDAIRAIGQRRRSRSGELGPRVPGADEGAADRPSYRSG